MSLSRIKQYETTLATILGAFVLFSCFQGIVSGQPYPEYVHIDFSQLPDGTPLAEATAISSQFSAYGVSFQMHDGLGGLPIVAQAGDPEIAFTGPNGSDDPMWGSTFGLTDPIGPSNSVTAFRPIRIDFNPPVAGVRLWLRHPGGLAGQGFLVRYLHQNTGGSITGGGCGNTELRRFGRLAIHDPQGDPITRISYECPNCVNPSLGYALCDLTIIRAPQQPLVGPFFRIAQESSPGAGDFDKHVLGVMRPWRSPSGLAPKARDFYFYAREFGNSLSYSGFFRDTIVAGASYIMLVEAAEGLTLVVVHDRTEGGTTNGCLPDAPAGDMGGHAEMRLKFYGLDSALVNTVQDDPPGEDPPYDDAYVLDAANGVFTSHHTWASENSDGFALSGLDGEWMAELAFTEITGAATLPIGGLNAWLARSSDSPEIQLALAVDRRIQIKKIDNCIAISDPVSVSSCAGGSVTFSASAVTTNSGGTIAYQWRKDGIAIADASGHISGSNSAMLTIANFVAADTGSYELWAINTCGTTTSAVATLSVFTGPPGDVNSDGQVNGDDIQRFMAVLIAGERTSPAFCASDMDQNAHVDVADVALFVESLLG